MTSTTLVAMPDDEYEAGEELPEPELDELPPEVPEADAVEQHQRAFGDDGTVSGARDLPFDAPEADVLEQRRDVPYDDEDGESI